MRGKGTQSLDSISFVASFNDNADVVVVVVVVIVVIVVVVVVVVVIDVVFDDDDDDNDDVDVNDENIGSIFLKSFSETANF